MLPAKNRQVVPAFPKKGFNGKRAFGQDLTLVYKKGGQVLQTKVSISKKVAKKAVDRNRIKRLVKESLKLNKQLKGKLLVVVRKNLADLKLQEVENKLEKLINKL